MAKLKATNPAGDDDATRFWLHGRCLTPMDLLLLSTRSSSRKRDFLTMTSVPQDSSVTAQIALSSRPKSAQFRLRLLRITGATLLATSSSDRSEPKTHGAGVVTPSLTTRPPAVPSSNWSLSPLPRAASCTETSEVLLSTQSLRGL